MKCQKMRKRENYTDTWYSTGMVSFSISWVWILDIFTSISAVFKTIDDFMHEKLNRKRISLGNMLKLFSNEHTFKCGTVWSQFSVCRSAASKQQIKWREHNNAFTKKRKTDQQQNIRRALHLCVCFPFFDVNLSKRSPSLVLNLEYNTIVRSRMSNPIFGYITGVRVLHLRQILYRHRSKQNWVVIVRFGVGSI